MYRVLKSSMAALLCCALALFGFLPSAFAVETDEAMAEDVPQASAASEETASEDVVVVPVEGEIIEVPALSLDDVVERAKAKSAIKMLADGTEPEVTTADSSRAIDYFDLPEWAFEFYEALEEGADNDGKADFLIDPAKLTTYSDTYVKGQMVDRGGLTYQTLAIDMSADTESATSGYISSCLDAALGSFEHDHNEVFWMWSCYSCFYSSTMLYYIIVEPDATMEYAWIDDYTTESIRTDIAKLDADVDGIISGLESSYGQNYSDSEASQYFNTWLTNNNEYNTAVASGRTTWETAPSWLPWRSLSALEGSTGANGPVCEGYARALKVLCDTVGIDCVLIVGDGGSGEQNSKTGLLNGGEGHMWNQMKMEDGNWYIADVTWDDPTGGKSGAVSGHENDDYLLIGGGTIVDGTAFWGTHAAYTLGNTVIDASMCEPSGIAYKSSYSLSDLSVSAGILNPDFASSKAFYQLTVSTVYSPLTFTATANSSSTSVKLYTSVRNSQDLSQSLSVDEGETDVWIQVTPSSSKSSGGEAYRITIDATSQMSISQETAALVYGQTLALAAIPAADESSEPIRWSSSNEAVATVTEDGLVTAVGEGEATITASTSSHAVSCTVTVGHTISEDWSFDDSFHWHSCASCNTEFDAAMHSYGDWEIVKEPTETETGLQQRVCSVCGYILSRTIAATGGSTPNDPQDGGSGSGTGSEPGPAVSNPGTRSASDTPRVGEKVEYDGGQYTITSATTATYNYPLATTTKANVATAIHKGGAEFKVTAIDENAFKGNKRLTVIKVGDNVTSIPDKAFSKCTNLKKVNIGKGVVSIGKQACAGLVKLKTVAIKSTKLKKIGAKCFKGCKKLKKLKIRSPKLKKSGVKKALAGSKVKTIKTTKKLKKPYQKIFTKKICGAKVKVR